MEDPNFEQTDLFAFTEEAPRKKKAPRKRSAVKEKISSKEEIGKEEIPQESAGEKNISQEAAAEAQISKPSWQEKIWEFDITHPTADIKAAMKDAMVAEGFTKREANHIFKGLFFKEKVCNTKAQALEYLRTVPTSYAVKYKIGIAPSPKMLALEKRLAEKEQRLAAYTKEQNEKKFAADFVTCPHCHSRVNGTYLTPPACPVCGQDMRSDTAVKTIRTLEETVQDLRKRYEDAARKYHSKFTGGEKWIIRLVRGD